MGKKRTIELANLVVLFGGRGLVDNFRDRFMLAQSGNEERTHYIDNQGSSAGLDEHLGQISRSDTKTHASDHLGSIINGEISGKAHTFNFGELLRSSPQLTEDSSPVMYGFTGRQYDPESSRYYYRARMYDPETGRFMTRDPIGLAGGDTNLYGYVGNDPVNWVDPRGTTIINLTGDKRISSSVDPNLAALYKSLDRNPNVTVVLSYGNVGGNFGSTSGTSSVITVRIDPGMQPNSAVLYNTLAHELTHASDITSGNLNSFNPYLVKENGDIAEPSAEGFANPLFERSNQCP